MAWLTYIFELHSLHPSAKQLSLKGVEPHRTLLRSAIWRLLGLSHVTLYVRSAFWGCLPSIPPHQEWARKTSRRMLDVGSGLRQCAVAEQGANMTSGLPDEKLATDEDQDLDHMGLTGGTQNSRWIYSKLDYVCLIVPCTNHIGLFVLFEFDIFKTPYCALVSVLTGTVVYSVIRDQYIQNLRLVLYSMFNSIHFW